VIKSDTLPATPYAWQNLPLNVEGAWESQEHPFPAFLVQSLVSADEMEMKQTVLPAVTKPVASSAEMASVKTHDYTFHVNGAESGLRLRAPDDMISSQSTNASARKLADARIPRPRGHTYWVGSKALPSITIEGDAVNTFTIVRNGVSRSVSCFVAGDAPETFYEQVYEKLGYGLKQFLGSQYKTKALGSNAKHLFSTHYAINPETGDGVTFTVAKGEEDETMRLVDVEMFLTKEPKPPRLQSQTFSLVPREDDPLDIQALCMAIEDRLDDLSGADAEVWENHLQVLLEHYDALQTSDPETIRSDIAAVLQVRNTIKEVQGMLYEPIGAESTQDMINRLSTYSTAEILQELNDAVNNVKRRREELAKSSRKQRRARWTKGFAAMKRKWRTAGTARAEKELRKLLNALGIVALDSKWSQDERTDLALNRHKAEEFLKSGRFGSIDEPLPDLDTSVNSQLLPERQRVIELKASPIKGFYQPDPTSDDVYWFKAKSTQQERAAYQLARERKGMGLDTDDKGDVIKFDKRDLRPGDEKFIWKKGGDGLYRRSGDFKPRDYKTVPASGRSILYPEGERVVPKYTYGDASDELYALFNSGLDEEEIKEQAPVIFNKLSTEDQARLQVYYKELLAYFRSMPEVSPGLDEPPRSGTLDAAKEEFDDAIVRNRRGTITIIQLEEVYNRLLRAVSKEDVPEFVEYARPRLDALKELAELKLDTPPTSPEKPAKKKGWFSRLWGYVFGERDAPEETKKEFKTAVKKFEKVADTKEEEGTFSRLLTWLAGEGTKELPEARARYVIRELRRETEELREAYESSQNYPHPPGSVPGKSPTNRQGQRNYYYGEETPSRQPVSPAGYRNYYYGENNRVREDDENHRGYPRNHRRYPENHRRDDNRVREDDENYRRYPRNHRRDDQWDQDRDVQGG
jgi:hypothetical protein